MKTRLSVLLVLWFACSSAFAEVHITIADPETWTAQELKEYVGQTVIFDVPIVVCSNASTNLVVSPRRFFTPTNQAYPRTPEYTTILGLNSSGRLTLSGVSGYHRCGEKIYNLKAKVNSMSSLTFVSGTWRGNTRTDVEGALPDLGDYDLLICTMNLENYFVRCLDPECLGADSYSDHQKQRTKIHKAMKRINADLFGLVELEDGEDAIKEITNDLNNSLPERNYKYVSMSRRANNNQMSDLIYDANKLEPAAAMQVNDAQTSNRKKMICMREKATGETFLFSVNHFKAKSGKGTGADSDQGDGQGSFNATRVLEAQSILDSYKAYSPATKEKDILIMGDLNAHGKEDPVTRLTKNGMIDLHRVFHADSSYSYQYSGLAGYLDHALCNETMYPQITGMAGYHINSDENDKYTYDKSNDNTMFRCSDHDPVLVGLKLDSTLTYTAALNINTADILSGKSNVLTIANGLKEGQRSFFAIYTIQGLLLKREEISDTFQEVQLPSRAGVYIVYIYFDGKVYQYKIVVR